MRRTTVKVRDFPWTCDICGVREERGATLQESTSVWMGGVLVHKDPRICSDNIEADKKKMQRENAALKKELQDLKRAS